MQRTIVVLSLVLVALLVFAACAKATPTATPTPPTPTARPAATPTSAPGVTPTVAPTATPVPPTPTLSPAQAAYEAARKNFETVVKPAALKEGTLTWYTCHSADEAMDEIATFNKLYPGIKVEYVYDSPGPLIERIKAESKAGKVIADVYNCGGTSGYILGWDGYAVEHTAPTAIDPALKWVGNMTPQDPSKLWTQFAYMLGGLLINTDLVPPDKSPQGKSWWDFVRDPWWDGKISMANPFAPGHVGGLTHIWLTNPNLGEAFIKALSDEKPKIFKTGGVDALARGEIYVLIGGTGPPVYTKPWKGSPIKDVYPLEGVYATNFHLTLVKGAPHPNAALVFIDAFLSKEMQQAASRWRGTPIRAGVEMAIPELALEGKPLAIWATPDVEKIIRTYYEWYDKKGYFK